MKSEINQRYRDKQYSTKEGHAKLIFAGIKCRARRENIPCTVTIEEVLKNLPDTCPALGIELSWCKRKGQAGDKDTSPSLDKFIPELGYVPGNIYWVSGLANKIKNKFSTSQIEQVANWMKQIENQ